MFQGRDRHVGRETRVDPYKVVAEGRGSLLPLPQPLGLAADQPQLREEPGTQEVSMPRPCPLYRKTNAKSIILENKVGNRVVTERRRRRQAIVTTLRKSPKRYDFRVTL